MKRRNFLKTLLAIPVTAIVGVSSLKKKETTGLNLDYYQELDPLNTDYIDRSKVKVRIQFSLDGKTWQDFETKDNEIFTVEDPLFFNDESTIHTRLIQEPIISGQMNFIAKRDTTLPT